MKEELKKMLLGFPMLTEEEMQLILDSSDVRAYKKGSMLLREGEVAKNCYSVLKGMVREYVVVDGEEKTTNFYTEGQPVNAFTSATSQTSSKVNWVCSERCVLAVGTESLEEEMCRLIPKLEGIIRKEVERYTGETQDELAFFMTSTPEQRYLRLIEKRPDLYHRAPQHQIASYLGITPESLSRIRKRIFSKKAVN
ncbi:Crp/Fnr family transcriptional regulator [Labilibacter marinus]|uniref:Crp/Fnr family transcriptional regulator n=1 Tax=Labilibacter marinus TaxID=1477105 RepID=UPI00082BD675|nr:Crp/Fnr family transcriptional regulator [Labilibacter marinus]